MPKSCSRRCHGVAKLPHDNAKSVILAKSCFKQYCLTASHASAIIFKRNNVSSQKIGGNKPAFRQMHCMTIEVRGKAPNFNGHTVHLALHLWGLPRIIEMIQNHCNE